MEAPFHRPVVCPILVGRTSYLAALEQAIDQARHGTGRTVLLAGEAGIGKSRLLTAALQSAAPHGLLLLRGHCGETDQAHPYAPLLDLLRRFRATEPAATVAPALDPEAADLVAVLPELAREQPGVALAGALAPDAQKRRLLAAFVRVFTHLTTTRPVLITLEDLQWSDESSLEVVLSLARHLATQPALLLLTYRSDEVTPELQHLLAELDRARLVSELVLPRLTRDEVGAMVRAIFDLQRPVQAGFLASIYEVTEGNPFFVEEVLRALIAAGDTFYADVLRARLPLDTLHLPRTVHDAVQRRVRGLSPATRQTLAVAAVAGRRFEFSVLRAALQCDEQVLLHQIKELIAAQLVVEESAERFAFRHALTRQGVYGALLARERQMLHGTLATTLEGLEASVREGHLAELAHHCAKAGWWAQARDYAHRAAKHALALDAPRAAVDLLTQAVAASRQLAQPLPAAVYRARGRAYETLGDFDAARSDHETALRVARAADDRRVEWQALLDLGLLWAARDYAQAETHLRAALDLARGLGDPQSVAASLNRLGNWYANGEQPDAALRHHQEALALMDGLDDPHGRAETFDLLGTASELGGDLLHGATYYAQAAALYGELDERQGLASMLGLLAITHASYFHETLVWPAEPHMNGERDDDQALALVRQLDWRAGEAMTLIFRAMTRGPCGQYAPALEAVRDGLAIAEEIGHRQWEAMAHLTLGTVYLDLLDAPRALPHLERGLRLAQETGSRLWIRLAAASMARGHIAHGALTQAEAVLARALGPDRPMRTAGERLCWCVQAELAQARHDAALALSVVDELIVSAANMTAERVIPHLWLLRGQALAALQRPAEALAVLHAARAAAVAQEVRPLLWRIDVALGAVFQAQKRPTEAATAYAAAGALAEDLAAALPDAVLRDTFLHGVRALLPRPPSAARAATQHFGGLTAREREVAILVARGLTNRRIAVDLVIAEETAAVHVKHILSKLGFTSRAQVGAWAVHVGLITASAAPTSPDDTGR